MAEVTLEDLIQVMRECAGEDEDMAANDVVANTDFDELGYDSLALMAASTMVEKKYRVTIAEDELARTRTLASFVDLVNQKVAIRETAS